MTTQKIGVIGAGAIGQLMFNLLSSQINSQADAKVYLIARELSSDSQTLQFTDLAHSSHNHTITLLGQDSPEVAELDLVIICVKAYQVDELICHFLPRLANHCHIILLHNGMGPHLNVAKHLLNYPKMGLSLATTSHGALKHAQWQVTHTGSGQTTVGHYTGHQLADSLKDSLTQAIPKLTWHADIITALWQKLIINCAINPLTAIFECKNGQLAQDSFAEHINIIVAECCEVAKADGISLSLAASLEMVYKVINLTANNISSMYQDILQLRKTEIDYISGYVVERAAQHQIAVPANVNNQQRIKALEIYR
ncbi:ketopantoate reductase family protein [Shewanella sp. OMA3-2]|uniref:ketopantoate reductase family protein n=1 Tax=Shewanella sp. OMA3-2 TaxID=2908650 RepID=UPI001F3229F5|nr:2-dehydropantoate 2-reductase [Shewanella sp. OMA3-2]UJF22964.1 2-dehydropantoate 2-reductase [Shewanella sp. OMA3-2]